MVWTIPNMITFNEWQFLKQTANLTKGYDKFAPEELDQAVVFYDGNKDYLDYLERKEIEDIIPEYVLLPKFFWEIHQENVKDEFYPELDVSGRLKELEDHYKGYWGYFQNRLLSEIKPMICNADPRDEQKDVIDFFIEEFNAKHRIRGVLQAAPGVGKTYMSIKLLAGFRAKGLIIVPNAVLEDQWKEAIMQFTNLTEDQIGIIQGSDLDKLQEEINKPIAIVKIQSLFSQLKRNKFHEVQEFYKFRDFIVYDECHNSGAATSYAKTSSAFLTPNIIGLSATPYRVGLNDYLLKSAIGETIYNVEHHNLQPDVEIHNVYTEFTPNEIKRLRTIGQDYVMFLGMFNSMMKSKHLYFEYLADVVAWNHSQGHNIVVLFSTIVLMEKLQNEIDKRHPALTNKILLLKGKTKQDAMDMVKEARKEIMAEYKKYKEELDIMVKSKKLKRKEAQLKIKERRAEIDEKLNYLKEHALDLYKTKVKESEIILSNYNLLSAGFDKSVLSNIIFGGAPRIGKISVIQSIGRVTRVHEGKQKPLVQYFIPSFFIESKASTSIILTKNIKIQYPDANFKYIGFQNAT
jgi:superfamily II DNA or RNA helicase